MTRKQFLQRSAWGFGSAFILPSLLQSCMTDHDIPPPAGGGDHPLFDPQFSWNDDAKIAVTSLIEMIPEAGDILGGLVDILWPSDQTDVWGEIRAQVEALIDQKIADTIYQQVQEDLDGLKKSITLYQNELVNGSPSEKLSQWLSTRNSFAEAQPHFQSPAYQLGLLPLFVQFGNLYIGILRDAVIAGQSWGRTDADHQQDIKDLQTMLTDFQQYSLEVYNTGRYGLQQKTPTDYHNCEPFKTLNAFDRQMYLTALDFSNLWPYLDVTKYPQGIPAGVKPTREIYSDPFGSCDNSGAIVMPQPPPTQLPTNVTVWGGDRINSVQVTYPAGTGPGGATQTKRGAGGGSTNKPYGGSVDITPANPMVWGRPIWGSIVNALQLGFQDGTATLVFGGAYVDPINKPNDIGPVGYPLSVLSRIHINGASVFYNSADCVVFGYLYWEAPTDKLNALRDLYVRTPKERTAAELTRKLTSGVGAGNLITDELRAVRKAYWAALKARAEALK